MAAPTLGLHLDHRVAPGEDERVAGAIAELLARPCFAPLTRVAAQSRERDPSYLPKQLAAITACLLDPTAEGVTLDCGRAREAPLVATARIRTGRHLQRWAGDIPAPLLVSTVVVPAEPPHGAALLDAFVELAALLQAVAGYIAVEPDHDRAHRAALAQAPNSEDVRDHYRRSQERRAHSWYDRAVETRFAGPEWGLLFGPRHLAALAPDPACFAVIRDAGAGKLALLTAAPEDALDDLFDRRLDAARQAIEPLLMDVSAVPVL